MKRIKSIGVFSVARTAAAVYGCLALIAVPFVLLIAFTAGLALPGQERGAVQIGVAGAILLAIMLPIFYAIVGFIAGAASAFVYNFVAKRLGGIEFETEQIA